MGAELLYALWETLYMVIVSTVLSGIFGSGVAILMIITGPSGLRPNAPLYRVLDVVVLPLHNTAHRDNPADAHHRRHLDRQHRLYRAADHCGDALRRAPHGRQPA